MTHAPARRIVIVGGPRTGKTTLAATLGLPARHTDDVMRLGWSAASAEVATWFGAPGPWVVEGVATARALRKWLAAHAAGRPCDRVILLWRPAVDVTPRQSVMARGVRTVWREIAPEVVVRGVEVLVCPEGHADAQEVRIG